MIMPSDDWSRGRSAPTVVHGLVDQGESCSGQFVGSGLHVVSVHDLELDARLGRGSIRRPFRGRSRPAAAWVSGQTPKLRLPSMASLCK
jgi:hypothetical protein